jgi:two-component system sensor histidine kinase MtrB
VHAIEDLARHEAGDLELAIEGIDLREIVRNVVADLKQLAEVRGISINTEYRTDDVVVAGDPKRLAQMIHHLVANAIQHEINGGRANIVLGDCDKDYVTIHITNPGTAIAEETLTRLHHLFAPDATDPALSPGQGVGLPLVATLLRLHQGTVDIDSNDEIGTSVRLKLPRLTTTIETETNDARSTFA